MMNNHDGSDSFRETRVSEKDLSDPELKELLQRWEAPLPDEGLEGQIRERFGQALQPWWRRSIAVPLPLAAAVLLFAVLAPLSLYGLTATSPEHREQPSLNRSPQRPPAPAASSRRASADPSGTRSWSPDPLVTPTDLSRFKPVPEVRIRVVSGERRNEK